MKKLKNILCNQSDEEGSSWSFWPFRRAPSNVQFRRSVSVGGFDTTKTNHGFKRIVVVASVEEPEAVHSETQQRASQSPTKSETGSETDFQQFFQSAIEKIDQRLQEINITENPNCADEQNSEDQTLSPEAVPINRSDNTENQSEVQPSTSQQDRERISPNPDIQVQPSTSRSYDEVRVLTPEPLVYYAIKSLLNRQISIIRSETSLAKSVEENHRLFCLIRNLEAISSACSFSRLSRNQQPAEVKPSTSQQIREQTSSNTEIHIQPSTSRSYDEARVLIPEPLVYYAIKSLLNQQISIIRSETSLAGCVEENHRLICLLRNLEAITCAYSFSRIPHNQQPMGRMERHPMEDHERKIIIEFCHLLEKSKQLFNGLRELPQYGHKQWHSYFGRTFDVYTKLWKFQQQHRAILDSKYGLKRWQIGEIASKIGQLYYHFYLRTSETTYLNEAFCFYYAIRARCYYTKACKEDKCELMVKKLRYYARFIVVCLLLKKIKLVRELIKELDRQIIEYGNTYDPDDQIEWNVVVDEVKAFIQAEPVVTVLHPDNYPVVLSHRLSSLTTPPLVERSQQMNLALQEVLIVGSNSQQVKFSELTMDMFRMLQTLEREPSGDLPHIYGDQKISPRQRFISTPNAPNSKGYLDNESRSGKENPHKYLLFKPSPSQVLVYLASGCNDLPPGGALLLYVSAEGQINQSSKHPDDVGFDVGGLITTSKMDVYRDSNKDPKSGPPSAKLKETQCLHPGDLHPFTRRPLFIIIDSDNSYVFQHIPRHFGQPLVILMSPLELPSPFHDRRLEGSLFTLFLHSPLSAICYLCDIPSMQLNHWDRGQNLVNKFMREASGLVTSWSRIDPTYIAFMGDDFLRLLVVRFIFCEVTLRIHRSFRARTHFPRASPPLPEEVFEHPVLAQIITDIAVHLQVRGHFNDSAAQPGPPPHRE